jgi:arylsulfatase A-like enzyme
MDQRTQWVQPSCHDNHIDNLLKALDDIGIANTTIVVYTTNNVPT